MRYAWEKGSGSVEHFTRNGAEIGWIGKFGDIWASNYGNDGREFDTKSEAKADVVRHFRVKRMTAAAKKRKRNPVEAAADLSEAFHGRPAETVTEFVDTLHEHSTLTGLGRLLSIKLKGGTRITFDKATQLASNEAGTQLFIVGGDQSIDLDGFEVDPTKEAVVLGQVSRLDYQTAKHHLGRTDKTPGPYTHQLGEESGSLPFLMYDTVNRQLSFVGGAYRIDVDMDGKYSAGIRD